jgi:proteic killer suppression protein
MLEAPYERNSTKGIQAEHAPKLRRILSALDVAVAPGDLDIPGFRLLHLKGRLWGHWSIWVSGNWRVTFGLFDTDIELVDYLDYHPRGWQP